jgi:hypothetical protein
MLRYKVILWNENGFGSEFRLLGGVPCLCRCSAAQDIHMATQLLTCRRYAADGRKLPAKPKCTYSNFFECRRHGIRIESHIPFSDQAPEERHSLSLYGESTLDGSWRANGRWLVCNRAFGAWFMRPNIVKRSRMAPWYPVPREYHLHLGCMNAEHQT